jgi:hypothetical protein
MEQEKEKPKKGVADALKDKLFDWIRSKIGQFVTCLLPVILASIASHPVGWIIAAVIVVVVVVVGCVLLWKYRAPVLKYIHYLLNWFNTKTKGFIPTLVRAEKKVKGMRIALGGGGGGGGVPQANEVDFEWAWVFWITICYFLFGLGLCAARIFGFF